MREKKVTQALGELQFNVAQLLREATGATRSYDIEVEAFGKLDEDISVAAPLVGQVKFLRTGQNILATGLLETTLEKDCGRCLTTFRTPVSIDLEEEFYPKLDIVTGLSLPKSFDADEANYIDEQHILDLHEVVRQELLLKSDETIYCRPDCKGLCPQCGQDRNTEPCNCQDEQIDWRWAGLKALQLEE